MFYAHGSACERPWIAQRRGGRALFIHRAVTSSTGSGQSSVRIPKDSTGLVKVLASISMHINALGLYRDEMRALEPGCI